MADSVYERRVENEWQAATELERLNTSVIRFTRSLDPDGYAFTLTLRQTIGISLSPRPGALRANHRIRMRFPRFFPAVPIEAFLDQPVFHPNIDPANGFLCLWDRHSPGDTVIEAVLYVQYIICWKMMNLTADHLMQPDAAKWYQTAISSFTLPLPFVPIHLPAGYYETYALRFIRPPSRKRLT